MRRTYFDFEVAPEYRPRPLSLSRRRELARLAAAVQALTIKTVLVDKRVRLDEDNLVSALVCDHLRSIGATVIETESGATLTSPSLLNSIFNSATREELARARRKVGRWKVLVKEWERNSRVETRSGRGRKPFGFRPGEAGALKRLFERYRALPKGERKHRSFQEIARIMNAEGLPTRTGKPWTASVVRGILKREGKLDTPSKFPPGVTNLPEVQEPDAGDIGNLEAALQDDQQQPVGERLPEGVYLPVSMKLPEAYPSLRDWRLRRGSTRSR